MSATARSPTVVSPNVIGSGDKSLSNELSLQLAQPRPPTPAAPDAPFVTEDSQATRMGAGDEEQRDDDEEKCMAEDDAGDAEDVSAFPAPPRPVATAVSSSSSSSSSSSLERPKKRARIVETSPPMSSFRLAVLTNPPSLSVTIHPAYLPIGPLREAMELSFMLMRNDIGRTPEALNDLANHLYATDRNNKYALKLFRQLGAMQGRVVPILSHLDRLVGDGTIQRISLSFFPSNTTGYDFRVICDLKVVTVEDTHITNVEMKFPIMRWPSVFLATHDLVAEDQSLECYVPGQALFGSPIDVHPFAALQRRVSVVGPAITLTHGRAALDRLTKSFVDLKRQMHDFHRMYGAAGPLCGKCMCGNESCNSVHEISLSSM